MKDEIKEILNYLGNDKNYNCDCNDGSYYLELPYREAHELKDCITNLQEENERLNNIINKFNKLLIEHIEEARYELNIILHSDNNLDYKNECAREFDILDKNIRMILDKLKELKGKNNEKD